MTAYAANFNVAKQQRPADLDCWFYAQIGGNRRWRCADYAVNRRRAARPLDGLANLRRCAMENGTTGEEKAKSERGVECPSSMFIELQNLRLIQAWKKSCGILGDDMPDFSSFRMENGRCAAGPDDPLAPPSYEDLPCLGPMDHVGYTAEGEDLFQYYFNPEGATNWNGRGISRAGWRTWKEGDAAVAGYRWNDRAQDNGYGFGRGYSGGGSGESESQGIGPMNSSKGTCVTFDQDTQAVEVNNENPQNLVDCNASS